MVYVIINYCIIRHDVSRRYSSLSVQYGSVPWMHQCLLTKHYLSHVWFRVLWRRLINNWWSVMLEEMRIVVFDRGDGILFVGWELSESHKPQWCSSTWPNLQSPIQSLENKLQWDIQGHELLLSYQIKSSRLIEDCWHQLLIIPVMAKLNFQQPLLQSSVSNDPSEIILICWFVAQETFLPIYQC